MINRIVFAAALVVGALPAHAGDVGVSIRIGEPGFSGEIDIGNVGRPALVYEQPVLIERAPDYDRLPPLYLVVPPGHEKHWRRHCAEYHACGRQVYFVSRDWYEREYAPRYQREHGRDDRRDDDRREGYRNDERRDDHGRGHEEERDHDHGHDRGRGHERGDDDRRDDRRDDR